MVRKKSTLDNRMKVKAVNENKFGMFKDQRDDHIAKYFYSLLINPIGKNQITESQPFFNFYD